MQILRTGAGLHSQSRLALLGHAIDFFYPKHFALAGFVQVMENLKVMEFKNFIFHACKIMKFNSQSLKVMENVDWSW